MKFTQIIVLLVALLMAFAEGRRKRKTHGECYGPRNNWCNGADCGEGYCQTYNEGKNCKCQEP